jgi:hypothetical protein
MLALAAGYLFYWSLGGTWAGGGEGPSGAGLSRLDTALVGLASLVYAGVLLVRVGYWRDHLPPGVTRWADINAWVVVLLPLGATVQSFATGYFVDGTFNLILAALAFVVVRSEGPISPRLGLPPRAGHTPGPPGPAGRS